MSERHTCPNCGHDFDADEQRRELEEHLREKMDHGAYDDASFMWMGEYEMYVYLPQDSIYTTTVEARALPNDWEIKTVWSRPEQTVVSIVLPNE